MEKISRKTPQELKIMHEAGKRLHEVKEGLRIALKEGENALNIEIQANKLIEKTGSVASFKKVPGYSWATCINIGAGIVHGIPKKTMVFKDGDVVSVDVGLIYKSFNADTSFTVLIGKDEEKEKFLKVGQNALARAIKQATAGNRIYDISKAIEDTVKGSGYFPVKALVGHGIGKNLHEEPPIPCFTIGKREDSPLIEAGFALAIEVMYTQGTPDLVLENDGWTISTADGKISALYEDTVGITENGPVNFTG